MSNPLRVLIVEDSVDDTFFIVRELQRGGFNVTFERVETYAAMQAAFQAHDWDLIICDYAMPQFSGPAALALYRQSEQDAPFIIVSGAMGEDRAVEMLKAGAHNYVMKDNLARLVPAVQRELEAARQRRWRHQTEEAKEYLALLVQSCDDAIIGKTLDGTIVSWNAAAERLYGYSAVEMIGQSIAVLVPPERSGELSPIIECVRKGDHLEGYETVRLRKGGTPIHVSLTISPIKDGHGRIMGASTIARKVHRKNPEQPSSEPLAAAFTHSGE